MNASNHQVNSAALQYPHNQQTSKSCHSHYPTNHPHTVDYQPYHPNNGLPRKCVNGRMCNSYDALTSPQQPLLPNPANWNGPAKSNGYHSHKCTKQSSQQQLYQCTSECSDHSLKSHSAHSQSSQERPNPTTANCKDNCHHRSTGAHKHHTHNGKGASNQCGTTTSSSTTNGNDILNGNDNIYENDDETTEHDRMITSTSDCCSSVDEVDGDSCCSCSLYAEATDPPQTVTTTIPQSQSTSSNQMAKISMQN